MEKIYERYNLRIEKIYNIFLSEQKGGATTDEGGATTDEGGATTDIIKSASNFKLKSDITSLQPIKSMLTEIEKGKSAEVDKIHNRVDSKSAETINPKFSEYEPKIIKLDKVKELDNYSKYKPKIIELDKYSKYEPKIIELEKGKELDKLDNSNVNNLKNIINDGDKETKIQVNYKFEDFKKLFEQDKTKDIISYEYLNLSSNCLNNLLKNKFDNFELEKEFVIEESKNHCFVCGEQISNIFFDKDEVSQLLNINTKEHKNLEYLNFIRCHKDCKIHTNLGIDKLNFNNGKLSVKDLGEIEQIIEEQTGGEREKKSNTIIGRERENYKNVTNRTKITDFKHKKDNKEEVKVDAKFFTLRESMDNFWNPTNQIASLRQYCTYHHLQNVNQIDFFIIRFIAEWHYSDYPKPCYLKDFRLTKDRSFVDHVPEYDVPCCANIIELRKYNNLSEELNNFNRGFAQSNLGQNLIENFDLSNNYDNTIEFTRWLEKRNTDLRLTHNFYDEYNSNGLESAQKYVRDTYNEGDIFHRAFLYRNNDDMDNLITIYRNQQIEHLRPHFIAIAEGKLYLPKLYHNQQSILDQYTNYLKEIHINEVRNMMNNFYRSCPTCNGAKNNVDNPIKRNFIQRYRYDEKQKFNLNMILDLNEKKYGGVIFYLTKTNKGGKKDKRKYFCLIKRNDRIEVTTNKLRIWLNRAMEASKQNTLEEQFAFLLTEINNYEEEMNEEEINEKENNYGESNYGKYDNDEMDVEEINSR